MIPNVYEIAPNLTVRVCQTKKLKAGMISLSAHLPIDRNRAYLNSLLLSVLHRGTRSYPTIAALNRRLDYLFGTEMTVRNYYRGNLHVIGTAADLLGADYLPNGNSQDLMEQVLAVMREILFDPLLDDRGCLTEHYVESEKKLQIDAIRALSNNPRAYAIEHCSAAMYRDESCGAPIYGTEKQVAAVTPQMLTEHWREVMGKLSLECFYVGPDRAEDVCERVGRVILPHLSREGFEKARVTHTDADRTEIQRVEEELPVSQGQLVIGLRTHTVLSDADHYACAVANEMLGVSPVSKLFVNVREKHGLCYQCSSHYNMYRGSVLICCGLLAKNRARAEEEIGAQIRALASGDFSEDEMIAAKRSLENAYRQIEDYPTSLESYYLGRALCGLEDSLEDARVKTAAVTREDVLRAVAKWRIDTVYFLNGTAPADGEEEVDEND
jgi:predicted Zn-dependent peptidase